MAFVQKLFTSYQGYTDGDSRLGEKNRIWYDSGSNTFRISDGETPGGIIIGGGSGGGSYTLPTASSTVKGGVKIGSNITITDGVISVAAPFSGSYNDLTNKPTLFSGSYNDLTNKPTIPSLTGYATESYVTGRGYITSSALTGYALTSQIPSAYTLPVASASVLGGIKLGTGLTIDVNGVVSVTGGGSVDLTGYATESYVTSRGYITSSDLSSYATQSYVTTALSNAGVTVAEAPPSGLSNGALWYNSSALELYVRYQNQWVATSSSFSGDYNDLTNKPTNVSQFTNDAGYATREEVYAMILELA
jgi:hypothetical protein